MPGIYGQPTGDDEQDNELYEETKLKIEAPKQQQAAPAKPERKLLRCRECGQSGYGGDYPFSTLPDSARLCDDCA